MVSAVVPAVTERQFAHTFEQLADVHRWKWYHPWISVRSKRGFPDYVLVKGERIIFAELKSESGKVSDDQDGWLFALSGCPCVETYIWRPSMWDGIVRVLGRK